METSIVRALDQNGNEFFATGRAGSAWVSADRAQAFTGFNLEGARRFAMRHNQNTALHGLRFVAVSA
jgi:hypothetical protein